jgi:predicted nucleotidyltransferase
MIATAERDSVAPTTVDANLRRLIDHVVAAMQPIEVWLFGSRAQQRARETSDYDLLVVTCSS